MISQSLKEIGLSETEVDVYLALLKTSGAQPASIVANKTRMNRTTAYKTLLQLAKRGLVAKTLKYGIISFYADEPEEKLKNLIESKQDKLQEANRKIFEELPALMMKDANYDRLPKVRYYEGVEGIKQIYEMILKVGQDYYRYGDITKIYGMLGEFTDEYIHKRNKLKIKAHAIMPYNKKGGQKLMERDKSELRESLYLPEELFPIEGEIRIFGDKVAILSLRKESPIGVVIESEVIAKMFKSIFMLTWENRNEQAFKI
jgi:predicted transcriptional regulator